MLAILAWIHSGTRLCHHRKVHILYCYASGELGISVIWWRECEDRPVFARYTRLFCRHILAVLARHQRTGQNCSPELSFTSDGSCGNRSSPTNLIVLCSHPDPWQKWVMSRVSDSWSVLRKLTHFWVQDGCARPLGRGVERQFFGAFASCSNPLADEKTFFFASLRWSHWQYCLFGVN